MSYKEVINNRLDGVQELLSKDITKYALMYMFLIITSGVSFVNYFTVTKVIKYIFLAIVPIILFLVMKKNKQISKNIKDINIFFIFICVFSSLSIIWSQSRGITTKNTLFLIATTVIAMYMGLNYTKEEIFKMLLQWFIILVVINLVSWIFSLPFVFDTTEMRYTHFPIKGIFKHRNLLAFYMVLTITLSLWFLMNNKDDKKLKLTYLGTIIGAVIILMGTKSMTCYLLLPVFIILILITKYKTLNNIIIYAILPLLLFSTYAMVCQPAWFQNLLLAIGRTPTLTDRSVIWNGVVACIKVKPMLGYGYTGLFSNNIYAVNFIAEFYGGLPSHCHNGYLDILIDFGFVGAVFIVAGFTYLFNRIKKLNNSTTLKDKRYVSYILSFLVFIAFYNLIESPIIKHCSTIYVLIIIFSNVIQKEWDKEHNGEES